MIPLVNLQRQYAYLNAFGARHGAACDNGTAAIELALKALGIGPGDEVVTVAHTFFATVEAILNVGATPVFAEIDPNSYTLNPATIAITPKTRALLPVHLYGAVADMSAIMALAQTHRLKVIEDTAQAHLATHHSEVAGTIGDAGTFSFYPGKNLGAYGDAGFVITKNADIAAQITKLADHGRASKYGHDIIGGNVRMDELQAAVLSVKLPHLPRWTARRQAVAKFYDSRLKPAGFKVIEPLPGTTCVYHLYVVEVADRDAAVEKLKAAGIGVGVHYPIPLHRQPALAEHPASRISLPKTERAAARVLSLPICADITDAEADTVVETVLRIARP
jgi:dTDP-4-amino-4,6-dideoxygalactose transaminase